jgi:hypothetical protein
MKLLALEFGSERKHPRLLWGKRANDERYCSLRIEDSPQLAVESFNTHQGVRRHIPEGFCGLL